MYLITINSFNWESEDFQVVQSSDHQVKILTNIYMRFQMIQYFNRKDTLPSNHIIWHSGEYKP